ncbi:MAG: hypothetical protein Q8L28_00280 [bacterium]|nr:hypothetical protein [bacterium]
MKEYGQVLDALCEAGWTLSSARLGADDWEMIVKEIPIGTPVLNRITSDTAITADGAFYNDYRAKSFNVTDINKEKGISAAWLVEEIVKII